MTLAPQDEDGGFAPQDEDCGLATRAPQDEDGEDVIGTAGWDA